MAKALTNPCDQCPFRRDVDPGICAAKDSHPASFIGQAVGPFFLPCHKQAGFAEDSRDPDLHQCAGAAAYRANCGYDHLPSQLLVAEADRERFFANPAEFLAHHLGVPVEQAERMLRHYPPEAMLEVELSRQGVRRVPLA